MGELENRCTSLCQAETIPPSLDLADLEAHFLQCEHCCEAVCLFDLLLANEEETLEIEAPEGFEYAVMTRIVHLKGERFALEVRVWDKARRSLVGTILLCLGAGSVYVIFREPVWAQLTHQAQNKPLSLVDPLKSPGSGNVLTRSARALLGVLGVVAAAYAIWKKRDEGNQ